MFPKWFTEWNRKNPTDPFQPIFVLGGVGGAVFVAAMLVVWGWPYMTESSQTGPRGTGMSVTKFPAGPDVTAAGYAASVEAAAADEVPIVDSPVSEGLTRAMRKWTGIPDLYSGKEDSYQDVVASLMISMTQVLNDDWGGHTAINDVGVTCYTCHRGQVVPSNIWFRVDPTVETMAGWGAVQNRVTTVSGSTSLPSDMLQKLLVEDGVIKVHDLEPRVVNAGTPTWQDTERTYSLMNYFSNSLNVNCNFCHNSRAFYDPAQVTPQWASALMGIDMVRDLNVTYLEPLEGVLPAERLGPVHADAPKAACATCHKGYSKPMQGLPMLADWPELSAPGATLDE